MDTALLRPGTPEDAAEVAEVWHRGWHDGHAGHVPDGLTAARTLAAFRDRAAAAVEVTTVAVVDHRVAGFVMVVGDEVEQVFVDRAHRGGGLAAALLDEAERQVAATGYDVAWLAVVGGNARARRFYERRGWADEGDLPYEVTAHGETFVSPCRRYTKRLR
ncbi:GNAT family N-acetyltransferase [Nocardioides panaciterrulae]|uniref:Putative acetyltransferase n=1 Tax=Nocardioides panaciterrulae TaxID=661492 RepID=A0A7Y9JCC2_9ACTN|nr:GNAT family N-acetyltransferase [Nocardioides panaciterrulae]NYD42114.1 putative acetyltransferase [Nocardioides panaciterrulae]